MSGSGECAREAMGAPCESLALREKKSHQMIEVFRLQMLSDRCKSHEFDRALESLHNLSPASILEGKLIDFVLHTGHSLGWYTVPASSCLHTGRAGKNRRPVAGSTTRFQTRQRAVTPAAGALIYERGKMFLRSLNVEGLPKSGPVFVKSNQKKSE